jgi:PhnB protein
MLTPILAVADIEASIAFYTRALGFEYGYSMADENGNTSLASVQLGDSEILFGVLETLVAPEFHGVRGIGVQIYIELPDDIDIDALYQQALAYGATITEEITDRAWGDRSFTLTDPDGYNLMLAQPPNE